MPAYIPNPTEPAEICQKLIDTIPHLQNLKLFQIAYLFRPEATVSNGKIVAGMTYRVDDRQWALTKNDFIIEFAKDVWDDATDEFKLALCHHELCHVGVRYEKDAPTQPKIDEKSGRVGSYIIPHEIEEFRVILDTYGAFHPALANFLAGWTEKIVNKSKPKGKAAEEAPAEDGDVTLG